MTPRKPQNPDAITLNDAASMLGLSQRRVIRLRRLGLVIQLEGHPSYSRKDVESFAKDPWLNGREAARILGVSTTRVSQLADDELIPVHLTVSGRRVYRLQQLRVVANARNLKFH